MPFTATLRPLVALAGLALLACSRPAAGPGTSLTPGLALVDVATGLSQPTDVAFLPDGRLVITEKGGALRLRALDGTLSTAATLPVDAASEKGLLGVAVPPAFAVDGRLVLYWSRAGSAGGSDLDRHRVSSFVLGGDGTLDLASEVVLVSGLRGPANHDGGALAVGPDGWLYVGVGDTGCNSGLPPGPALTPSNYFATCLTNANGKILRVGLDGAVPADNPLATVEAATACGAVCGAAPTTTGAPRREIWAWGFRNPWRMTFDPATGLLWVGDLGEVSFEEVTIARAGRHHGWPWREGANGWPVAKCREVVPDTGDCVDPAYQCRHGAAAGGVDGDCDAITGGVFLPAPRWPAPLAGRYLFADNDNGRVWTLDLTADRTGVVQGSRREVARLGGSPVSLRIGPEGDAYVVLLAGTVARLTPAGP